MIIREKRVSYFYLILLFITLLSVSVFSDSDVADSIRIWGYCDGVLCSGYVFDKTCEPPEVVGDVEKCSQDDYDAAHYCQYEGNYYFDAQSECDVQGTTNVAAYGPVFNIDWDNDEDDCDCYGKDWLPGVYYDSGEPSCCGDDDEEHLVDDRGTGAIDYGLEACCNSPQDCLDRSGRCQDEYINGEETCEPWDGFDDDCDGWTDCSDDSCFLKSVCIGCEREDCDDGIDNDCDHYVDCSDNDCIDECGHTTEICSGDIDEDNDGKIDCKDLDCIVYPGCEGYAKEVCDDGIDNDQDGLKDSKDWDCPGCPLGTTLCQDGACSEDCDIEHEGAQGCIAQNDICEEGEGCACEDCFNKRDSCDVSLICDPFYEICSCPAGTSLCPDGTCKESCNVCGNGELEPGEECDGSDFGEGVSSCPTGCTGALICTAGCKVDASSCTCLIDCDPENGDDDYCCGGADFICDQDCTENADPDCIGKCTPEPDDCCNDQAGDGCDLDCIPYKDPDCSESCTPDKDDCCNAEPSNGCDPDCNQGVDTDCGICTSNEGDCCNDISDDICDPDCIPGVDTDCLCGNLLIDSGEMCDRTNLGNINSCEEFFGPGYSGILSCFKPGTENSCSFDTSGCYKVECVDDPNGVCETGEDCRCPDCLGEQAICGYGQVCDEAARCACEDGKTLCNDTTCRLPAECEALPGCKGETPDNVCDSGEGCDCEDCWGETDTCQILSTCLDGVCASCSILTAYWTEDCIGSGVEVSMIAEGTPGCKGKTVNFQVKGKDYNEDFPVEFEDDGKAEKKWKAEIIDDEIDYKFKTNISNEIYESEELEVRYCIPDCDADCDRYCDTGKVAENGDVLDTVYCGPALTAAGTTTDSYCETTGLFGGSITIDANALSGWCEDCDPYGMSPGQETCAAYYDCTPGWWGENDADYTGADDAGKARNYLDWGECGYPKVESPPLDAGREKVTSDLMRQRLICPPDKTKEQCCKDQGSCYCKFPTDMPEGLDCSNVAFRPSEIKACLAEEKFPFFTNMNILIVVLILIGFYLWRTNIETKKKTKKKKSRTKK